MAQLLSSLQEYAEGVVRNMETIEDARKPVLNDMISFISNNLQKSKEVKLNFICTHNSRRSQLSQVWAQTAAYYFGVDDVITYSGGVEVTAFNERAVNALEKAGFVVIKKENKDNPVYFIHYSDDADPLATFSKLYDDAINAQADFAAVMTCSDADENCPFIPGATVRIPLRYEDPKAFDGTELEASKYLERSLQIATEMFFIFSKVSQLIKKAN